MTKEQNLLFVVLDDDPDKREGVGVSLRLVGFGNDQIRQPQRISAFLDVMGELREGAGRVMVMVDEQLKGKYCDMTMPEIASRLGFEGVNFGELTGTRLANMVVASWAARDAQLDRLALVGTSGNRAAQRVLMGRPSAFVLGGEINRWVVRKLKGRPALDAYFNSVHGLTYFDAGSGKNIAIARDRLKPKDLVLGVFGS